MKNEEWELLKMKENLQDIVAAIALWVFIAFLCKVSLHLLGD